MPISGAVLSDPQGAETALRQAVALHQQGRLDDAEPFYRAALGRNPDELNALHLLGVLRQQQGRAEEALALIGRVLAAAPGVAVFHGNYGNALKDLGRFNEAVGSYRRAVALDPSFVDAHYNLGRLLKERGAFADAAACFEAALALEQRSVEIRNDLGLVLQELGRYDEAIRHYRAAATLAPDQAALHHNLGAALFLNGDFVAAEASLRQALALQPGLTQAEIALGSTLNALDRPEAAVAHYRTALVSSPGDATLHSNLGTTLLRLDQEAAAEAALRAAVALRPDQPEIRVNYGNALNRLGRREEALEEYRRALALDPDSPDARNNLACILSALGQREAAIAEYRRALDRRPGFADAHFNLGNVLQGAKRYDEAAESFRQALAVEPDHRLAAGGLLTVKRFACDWSGFDADQMLLGRTIEADAPGIDPFTALAYPLTPLQHRRCAEATVERRFGRIAPLPARPRRSAGPPIRLAYLSANYHGHAVASLIAEVIERHDRTRFEVTGISFGPDDTGAQRQRLVQGFDRFVDVRAESDSAVAHRLAELEIDIAVDLMGHTLDHRMGILAYRPAPLQVSFLGYPGTTGARFIDYVIADAIVLPRDQQPFWTEQIVHLPGCYQANDSRRPILATRPGRAECGLPEQSFVFCCFNNNYKITPQIFACWMRLLAAVPGSVLWLLRDNDDAARHLAGSAAAQGIDPARLIFAPVVASHERHLARQRQADLFLDTLPYNAHTTASDALRVGLPLVTCRGTSFAARVAASLLTALDLPELITTDLDGYEALTLALARDPVRLAAIRLKLARNAATAALFDGERFRIGLEASYEHMLQRHRQGLAPAGFTVPAAG
jgi:protein O-GlcNAc transferase